MPREFPFDTYAFQAMDAMDWAASPRFEAELSTLYEQWHWHATWGASDYAHVGQMHAKLFAQHVAQSTPDSPSVRQRVRFSVLGGALAKGQQNWAAAYEHFATALAHVHPQDLLTQLDVLYHYAEVSTQVQDYLQCATCWVHISDALRDILALDINPPSHLFCRALLCEALTNRAYYALAVGDYDQVDLPLTQALHLLLGRMQEAGIPPHANRAEFALPYFPWDVFGIDQDLAATLLSFLAALPEDAISAIWHTQAVMVPWMWALGQYYQYRLGRTPNLGTYQHCVHIIQQLADVSIARGGTIALKPQMFSLLVDIPFAGLQEASSATSREVWFDLLIKGYQHACRCWQASAADAATAGLPYLRRDAKLIVRYARAKVAGEHASVDFIAHLISHQVALKLGARVPTWGSHLVGKAQLLYGITLLDAGRKREARRAFQVALDVFTDQGFRKAFMPRQHEIQRFISATHDT